jgi:hypothetical protein
MGSKKTLWPRIVGLHSVVSLYTEFLLRAASDYGQRLRGCRSPPIKLQETTNLASRPFTLEAKVQRLLLSKMHTRQKKIY